MAVLVNPSSASARPTRCAVALSDGAWYAQEQHYALDGTLVSYGSPVALEVVSAPGTDVTTSRTSLTLKSGLATTSRPDQATVKWRLALSSLPGLSLAVGKQHTVTVTADALPAPTINSFFGAALVVPTGAWDDGAETVSAISLGFGQTAHPSVRYAVGTASWSTLIGSDDTVIAGHLMYSAGSQRGDVRALSASAVPAESHQSPPLLTPTYLYLVGFVQTAALLADATYANPTVTISYGS